MKAYLTLDRMIENPLLDLITICNCISTHAGKLGGTATFTINDDEETKDSYNKYIELVLTYNYITPEDIEARNNYIQQEKDNLLKVLDIAEDDFQKVKSINKQYIETYWLDLHRLKMFDIIGDMMVNVIVKNHDNVLSNQIMASITSLMTNGINDPQELSVYTIAMEDMSTMTLSAVLLLNEQKIELNEFYIKENLIEERIEDYEGYLREKLGVLTTT